MKKNLRKVLLGKSTETEEDCISWIGVVLSNGKSRRQVCGVTHTHGGDVRVWYYPEFRYKSNIFLPNLMSSTGETLTKKQFKIQHYQLPYNYIPSCYEYEPAKQN